MGTPDFVIVGVPGPDDQVTVWASKTLSHAELRAEIDTLDVLANDGFSLRPAALFRTYTLTCHMGTMFMARGPDYGSALRTLMTHWTPERPGRPGRALPVSVRELDDPSRRGEAIDPDDLGR